MQPNAEMSSGHGGFDLKAAREICSRIKGYEDPDGGNSADFQAAEMLPAALDWIERLEAAYLKAQNSNLLRKQAYESLEKIANKQRAALKKLGNAKRERGKALVEERAQRIYPFSMPRWGNVPEDDELLDHALFEKARQTGKNTYRWHAREELRQEGKL